MRWMWIDQIVEFVPRERLCAIKNVSLAEEYLHDHFPPPIPGHFPTRLPAPPSPVPPQSGAARPVMPASLMIEGMAQTAGILVGSVNQFREKVILAKVVAARFEQDVFPGQTIRYDARLERIDPLGASTTGIVQRMSHTGEHAGQWQTIGQIDLMFSHLDQNMAGLEFPKDNFVFSDNFRTILSAAGLHELADQR